MEENFQLWLEKNWDRPLSDEIERLQHGLERLKGCIEPTLVGLKRLEQRGGD